MIRIEYVDRNHNGLSPMADAIARDYLTRSPLHSLIYVTSSGTALHPSLQPRELELRKIQRQAVVEGLKNDLFKGPLKKDAEFVLARNRHADAQLLGHCYRYLQRWERTFRDTALGESGYYYPDWGPVATEPYNVRNVDLILALNKESFSQAQAIYDLIVGIDRPKIVLHQEYAEIKGELSDLLGAPLEKHQEARDILHHALPRIITHARMEFL